MKKDIKAPSLPSDIDLKHLGKQDFTAQNLEYVLGLYPLVKLKVLAGIFKFESFIEFIDMVKSDSRLSAILDDRMNDLYGADMDWFGSKHKEEKEMRNTIPWDEIEAYAKEEGSITKKDFEKRFPDVSWQSVIMTVKRTRPTLDKRLIRVLGNQNAGKTKTEEWLESPQAESAPKSTYEKTTHRRTAHNWKCG